MKKYLENRFGNDRERGKCTYVTRYGLDEAQRMLKQITNDAIETVTIYKEKGEFLKNLAIYIATRNK